MPGDLVLNPLLDWRLVAGLAALAALLLVHSGWRGLEGLAWRGAACLAALAALLNPTIRDETREGLPDLVVLVVDESGSQSVGGRPAQTERAVERARELLEGWKGSELAVYRVGDSEGDSGTELMSALDSALSDLPSSRISGIVLVTDGHAHDMEIAPEAPAPVHALLTGEEGDWDRRIALLSVPSFGIVGEKVSIGVRVEDEGDAPPSPDGVALSITVDGGRPQRFTIPTGIDQRIEFTLPHAGVNVLELSVPALEGELTDRNNYTSVRLSGVRDRLRVLLATGQPYPGSRTWRNLLKSDAAVDLVHFVILRTPLQQRGVPSTELSLIAFPVQEVFSRKINEFDLIIFDRFQRPDILGSLYFDSIRDYVRGGGALLVVAGPETLGGGGLYNTSLGRIVPGLPKGRILESAYRPAITDLGARHPVTAGLDPQAGGQPQADGGPGWGRWLRQVELEPDRGHTLLSGAGGAPLLTLDRAGSGRVAILASDHAWLWHRGYEGGGPQLELLRRLAHWMMREPELEEETLSASVSGAEISVVRRSLSEVSGPVSLETPSGASGEIALEETAPGVYRGVFEAGEQGLHRLRHGRLSTVAAVGAASPREFERVVASGDSLEGFVRSTRGGIFRLSEGFPRPRAISSQRVAHGKSWLGLSPRGAYVATELSERPLAPGWIYLLLCALLMVGAWVREGRWSGDPRK